MIKKFLFLAVFAVTGNAGATTSSLAEQYHQREIAAGELRNEQNRADMIEQVTRRIESVMKSSAVRGPEIVKRKDHEDYSVFVELQSGKICQSSFDFNYYTGLYEYGLLGVVACE